MSVAGFPKGNANIIVLGPMGDLECATSWPAEVKQKSVMLVCHPHPLHSGTMNNKVVTTLCRCANKMGMPAVRFNFRGVGKSDGVFDNAVGEQADAIAVLDWIKSVLADYKIVLAGFSFGSYVAASICSGVGNCRALISVAPPVHHYDFSTVQTPECPWLVLMGDQDEVVPVKEVDLWVKTRKTLLKYEQFDGCGHFFHGRLIELQEKVMAWLTQLGH